MIRYYQGCHTLKELRETQVKVTQGSFWSLREGFLTQRVATLYYKKKSWKLREVSGYSGKFLVTQGRFFDLKIGNPVLSMKINCHYNQ